MYAELHCRTNYSFLVGGSHPDELVERAIELDYAALAITDEASLAGVVRAFGAARRSDLKLIVGTELRLDDGGACVLWARDRAGYGRLCRLLTLGRRRAPKGECRLTFDDLAAASEGLLVGVLSDPFAGDEFARAVARRSPLERASAKRQSSPCGAGDRSIDPRDPARLGRWRELFGDRSYLLAEPTCDGLDRERLAGWAAQSQRFALPLTAAGDVLYHVPERQALQQTLTAIRLGTTVEWADGRITPNASRHLQSLAERKRLFAEHPAALARTLEIADRCVFSLDQLRYEYPEELTPDGRPPMEFLRELTWQGAARRYPGGLPGRVRELIEHELKLIEELRYEAYFLTVWDLVRFARERRILCQGRGSAANSAVCFCLGITAVDPGTTDVLFERFISRERNEAPDIDVDFEHERREEVLQYLYGKYGRERAGLAATVITYRVRSAVRDVGKALGLSLDRVDALAKQVDLREGIEGFDTQCRDVGIDPASDIGRLLGQLVPEILGFPRHLSQHVGGMVMTRGPLCELVPIENAAMPDRTVVQWDKDDLEELGILKVDCLCLGMLSAIRRCFEMIRDFHGRPLSLASIPQGDTQVYDMICAADTMGVFQIESRAQMSMLPRLRPRCYYDLVIEVAIVRPGPIQGQMVHPYLRRRAGEEQVEYPNDAIRDVLHKTLGVPIFQEQAMRLAVVAAGFTPGEADQLRRAMGAWRKTGVIEKFRVKLLEGMRRQGLSETFADQVFRQIRGFGEYGFPESHAASFALLVYVSCWLKHHYPAAFVAGLINSQPMGFYAPAQLIDDARRHDVPVRPIDVNFSDWDCTLEPDDDDPIFLAGFVHHRDRRRTATSTERAPEFGDLESLDDDRPAGPDDRYADAAACAIDSAEAECRATGGARVNATEAGSKTDGAGKERSPHRSSRTSRTADRAPSPSPALRLGFRLIDGLPQTVAETIMAARRQGSFRSISEFARRTGLGRAILSRLADADAFRSLDDDRRRALWDSLAQERRRSDQPLLDRMDLDETEVTLPAMSEQRQVHEDYRTIGLSLRGHPIGFHRAALRERGVLASADLERTADGTRLEVGGLVILRQRPSTAKGITFVTLEDESGTVNLVIRPDIWERHRNVARRSPAWIVRGKLERRSGVTHVIAESIDDLASALPELRTRSRDFR
ncbi:MAG TPA: error-prone DNA polymerase [Pirellulaceae bacterium]|nr:error-prone DNA polymerase [Pirellulaceae bacterium]